MTYFQIFLCLFYACLMSGLHVVAGQQGLRSLQGVLLAIDNIVTFYENNYEKMNIDGIYGSRFLEGQMELLLQDLEKLTIAASRHEDLIKHISQLRLKAEKISDDALPQLQSSNPDYFDKLAGLVKYGWRVHHTDRELDSNYLWKEKVDLFDEATQKAERRMLKQSDDCMAELLQTGVKRCIVSLDCCKLMTKRGYSGYALSHQLLYTVLAEQMNCTREVDAIYEELGTDITSIQVEMCTNSYAQVGEILSRTNYTVLPKNQDWIMEIEFVCLNLGFYEYLDMDLLEQMISWQKPSGCYGRMPRNTIMNINDDNDALHADGADDDDDVEDMDETIDEYDYEDSNDETTVTNSLMDSASDTHHENDENTHRNDEIVNRNNDKDPASNVYLIEDSKLETSNNTKVSKSPETKTRTENDLFHKRHNNYEEITTEPDENNIHIELRHVRKLLSEIDLHDTDGCLVHKTSVALCALTMYAKYFITTYINNFQNSQDPEEGISEIDYTDLFGEHHRNAKHNVKIFFDDLDKETEEPFVLDIAVTHTMWTLEFKEYVTYALIFVICVGLAYLVIKIMINLKRSCKKRGYIRRSRMI
ncbi:unnamed protein product [Owenia fusiformis]|uniref:Uncharacterized protein n=1 Tax=Owenia fusiformis TaxID=6347 RepID=A0A8S4PFR8_OWEFU|nr:unnamed protein product [Owenia fusiformis]